MKKYEEQLKNNFDNIRIMRLMLVNFLDETSIKYRLRDKYLYILFYIS